MHVTNFCGGSLRIMVRDPFIPCLSVFQVVREYSIVNTAANSFMDSRRVPFYYRTHIGRPFHPHHSSHIWILEWVGGDDNFEFNPCAPFSLLRTVNHFIDSITVIKLNARHVPTLPVHFPILHAIISSVTFTSTSCCKRTNDDATDRPAVCFS